MASAAPSKDPVGLSYPLTGLAALAAMAAFAGAFLEVRLSRALRSLLSRQSLAALNASVGAVVSAVGLLLLLVAADKARGGDSGAKLCASGARVVLVAHTARLACDVITAVAALLAARCPKLRPPWLHRAALLLLHILTWPLAAFAVLLPANEGATSCATPPVRPGTAGTVLLVLDWSLLIVLSAVEITSAALYGFRRHCRRPTPTSSYNPGSGPSAWSSSEPSTDVKAQARPKPSAGPPWGVHPAVVTIQLFLLLPLSVMAFREHAAISAQALLGLRWLFFYLLVTLALLHNALHGLDLFRKWRQGRREGRSWAELNAHLVPSTLQEIQRLEEEGGAKMPGVLQFRAKWRQQGRPQLGLLRAFSPAARPLWSSEAAAAQLLHESPHANLCRFLWTSARTPFHAGLACLAEERVTKTWRVTCRADLDRGSLATLLRREPYCLSEGFIFGIVSDLARALVHLRKINLVHGRLCPEVVAVRGLRDGSFRAVLCDFHLSRRLVDLSLAARSDHSFAYSLSTRSGLLDSLRDQQFAPDLRALLLLLLELLLAHLERRTALSSARASASPSLERVAEEDEEGKAEDATDRREGVYEPLDPLASASTSRRSQTPVGRRRAGNPPASFDNGAFELREEVNHNGPAAPDRRYENLPGPASPRSSDSGSERNAAAHPDLVRTAVEQRKRLRQRNLPGSQVESHSSSPRPPSSPAVLSHEEEYCLRLAREHPKWVNASLLLTRDRRGLLTLAKTMRGGLSPLGAEMAELALTHWSLEPCASAESFLRSLKAAAPRSAL